MGMRDKLRDLVRRTAERQSVLPDARRARYAFPPPPPPLVADPFEGKPLPVTGYSQALTGMVDTEFIKTVRYGEQQFRADAFSAHPVIVEFSTLLVKRMRKLGVPMFAHCIWRTKQEQDDAFRRGVSKVEYPNSAHNRGCAVDVIHSTKAWDLSETQWQIVGHVGRELAASKGWKLVWGGDDPGVDDAFNWDPAHWELANWRSHAMVRRDPPKRAVL